MPPQKSAIWNYFKRSQNGNTVKCTLCDAQLTFCGDTTNLTSFSANLQTSVKLKKIKKVRRVFECENCTRVLGLRVFVAIPIEHSWKSGKCMNKSQKEKKVKENTTRQSENRQPSDVQLRYLYKQTIKYLYRHVDCFQVFL
jgi:hypothetical protein